MAEQFNESTVPQSVAPPSRQPPFREDCWSEEATSTLVDAWGRRFLELNRGNLRQKDWQAVADMVNSRHGHTKKTRRTDVQCKNRIDTLKKKYKSEKARVSASNGVVSSSWSFFSTLDSLIGSTVTPANKKIIPTPNSPLVPLAYTKPVRAVVIPQKRPSSALDNSYFRKNYSAVAAAAAAADIGGNSEDNDDASEDLGSSKRSDEEGQKYGDDDDDDGIKRMAKAIVTFGQIYERVEKEKQRQMIELEKQRMQFMKDIEVERMQLFMDTQVQLEKVRQSKRYGPNDIYRITTTQIKME